MATAGDQRAADSTLVQIDDPEATLTLDLAAAAAAGVRRVRVASECVVSTRAPGPTLNLVRLLREAIGHGIAVSWRGRVDDVDTDLLVHLPPPQATPDDGAARWRARHAPGLCYYRLGPGFVLVKDVRRPDAGSRLRLDDAGETFRALEAVTDLSVLRDASPAVVADLEREDLVLRVGNLCTLLPHRMRRWPVPAMDV